LQPTTLHRFATFLENKAREYRLAARNQQEGTPASYRPRTEARHVFTALIHLAEDEGEDTESDQ
jgi:hypothetical protein